MQKLQSGVAIALVLSLAGPALAQEKPCKAFDSRAEAKITNSVENAPDSAYDKVLGRTAAACGVNDTAARLFERVQSRRSTPIARFNLATAYARLGRIEEARALYRSAALDGQFQSAVADPLYGAANSRPRKFNVADEARRRLAQLDAYVGSPSRLTAISAGDVATDASAAPSIVRQADLAALSLDGSR